MARKFEVIFSRSTHLRPSLVFVSPSEGYAGKFSAAVLHCTARTGTFQPDSTRVSHFELKQNLLPSEQQAIDWAKDWLEKESGGAVTLSEVASET